MKADTAVIILAHNSVIQLSTVFSLNRSWHKKEIVSMTGLLVFKYYIKPILSQGTKRECKLQT